MKFMPSKDAKRKKKIVAVALSAAMCLGLSMTAFAAEKVERTIKDWESPNYMTEAIGPLDQEGLDIATGGWLRRVTDAKGNSVEYTLSQISEGTWESIKSEEKVQEIFAKAGYEVNKDMDFIPLASATITLDNGVPEGGAVLNFSLADMGIDASDVRAGDVIYVMQETAPGSGVWDILPATVTTLSGDNLGRARGDMYQISVNVPRNGALVVVKVMSNGDVITLDKTTNTVIDRKPADTTTPSGQTSTSNPASAGTSPKTGEF